MITETAPIVGTRQTLSEMLLVKNKLMDAIYENEGEITTEQEYALNQLDISLLEKVDGWAWTLKKDGAIDKEIELWQERKQAIEGVIKSLKTGKERLKSRANQLLEMNGLERMDGNQFWIKRDVSRTKSVSMDMVEDEFKRYELPELDYKQYKMLVEMIEYFNGTLDRDLPFESIYTAIELQEKIKQEKKEKCNVSDLPEGHNAVITVERPTVRIYYKK